MASLTLGMGMSLSALAAELGPEDTYTIHGLASFETYVSDMNDLGITSGRAAIHGNGDTFPHAAIWDESGALTDLDPNFLNDSSFASGINNHGDAVGMFYGFVDQLRGPVLFTQGSIVPLLDQDGAEDATGRATDINDNGLIVGCAGNVPVIWDNSVTAATIPGTPDGTTGCALTANNQGEIVGYVDGNGGQRAVLWHDGVMVELGTLPGHETSIAYGINELGQIVGSSKDTDGSHGKAQHPFLWDNGVMTDLGILSGNTGTAYDINERGEIVGNAPGPFLYRDGIMYDLKSVATLLQSAVAINASGQIAGSSYVLTPALKQLDMTVTLTAPTGPLDSGTEYEYRLTVTNRSTIDGQGVSLRNSLSSPLQVIAAVSEQGSCGTTKPVICELGTVAAGTSVNVVLTVKAEVPFSRSGNLVYVSNYATVSSSNTDVNSGNNSAYQSTTIIPPPEPAGADVAVSLSDSPDPVRRGDRLTYTATVTNNGPLTAENTVLTQSIYARFRLRAIRTTHGNCSGRSTITCNLGELAANETATITVVISPRERSGSRFFSSANVSSDSYDPAVYNNSVAVMTSVR